MSGVFAYNGGLAGNGTAPTAVLLHGAGMDHTVWHHLTRYLAHRGWRVLALDLPGHGRTTGPNLESVEDMTDWVMAFLMAAGVGNFCLVGHSLGGLIALRLASACHRVDRLVLMAAAAEMGVHPDLQGAADAGEEKAVELILSWSFGAMGRRGGHSDPGTSALAIARRILRRGLPTTLAADLRATKAYGSGADDAPLIRCETLILTGGEDRMVSASASAQLAALVPRGRLEIVSGGGHMLMISRPDEMRKSVVNFLAAE
ncbi:MAG TPA: alpha/beta hydrolase [Acidimicrobiia bacterium]|nr:alpha/beta hydrolase [Acidimicrobiia bacterium]